MVVLEERRDSGTTDADRFGSVLSSSESVFWSGLELSSEFVEFLVKEWSVAVFEESLMRAFSYGVYPDFMARDFGAYTLSRGVIELTIVNLVSSLTARVEIRFLVASLG
ncbi:hypothetical protein DY000_02024417 [Brassica cretica]|uniref:Uncharacterized protein n=1 Tax=Brassica cretica TaxID=69181 RepID=A0ABQ7ENN7_BRACR|nr:hypothetical protein DY000_02024417 [Brassica cretica]